MKGSTLAEQFERQMRQRPTEMRLYLDIYERMREIAADYLRTVASSLVDVPAASRELALASLRVGTKLAGRILVINEQGKLHVNEAAYRERCSITLEETIKALGEQTMLVPWLGPAIHLTAMLALLAGRVMVHDGQGQPRDENMKEFYETARKMSAMLRESHNGKTDRKADGSSDS